MHVLLLSVANLFCDAFSVPGSCQFPAFGPPPLYRTVPSAEATGV